MNYIERKALIERIESSGESIPSFCKRNRQYSVTTLYRWKKQKPPITRKAFEQLSKENEDMSFRIKTLETEKDHLTEQVLRLENGIYNTEMGYPQGSE